MQVATVVCISLKLYKLITMVSNKLYKGSVYNQIPFKQKILNKMEPYIFLIY